MGDVLNTILKLLDLRVMAEEVDRPHDNAFYSYRLKRTVPRSYSEFQEIIQAYWEYHYAATMSKGGRLREEISFGRAAEIVERAFGNQGGLVGAYENALVGTNRGMYASLEAIANALKEAHRRDYVRWVIDAYISPLDFAQRVAVVRALQKQCPGLGKSYVPKSPEELAASYYELIVEFVQKSRGYVPTYYTVKER